MGSTENRLSEVLRLNPIPTVKDTNIDTTDTTITADARANFITAANEQDQN